MSEFRVRNLMFQDTKVASHFRDVLGSCGGAGIRPATAEQPDPAADGAWGADKAAADGALGGLRAAEGFFLRVSSTGTSCLTVKQILGRITGAGTCFPSPELPAPEAQATGTVAFAAKGAAPAGGGEGAPAPSFRFCIVFQSSRRSTQESTVSPGSTPRSPQSCTSVFKQSFDRRSFP